jgi:hypothetical protein
LCARCRFDIAYKQRIGAEDVYLGMSGRTPSSVDCDEIVVKVYLPGAKFSELDLHVEEKTIKVTSSI